MVAHWQAGRQHISAHLIEVMQYEQARPRWYPYIPEGTVSSKGKHLSIRQGQALCTLWDGKRCNNLQNSCHELCRAQNQGGSSPKLSPFIPEHDCFICQHAFLDVALIPLQQHGSINAGAYCALLHSPLGQLSTATWQVTAKMLQCNGLPCQASHAV